jgi:adenylate cyclase
LHPRTARTVRIVVTVAAVAAGVGIVFTVAQGGRRTPELLVGAAQGALTGTLIALLEVNLQGQLAPWMRRLPLAASLALRIVLYGAILIGTAMLRERLAAMVAPAMASARVSAVELVLAIAVSVTMNFVFVLRRLLGPRTLGALVVGRYRRPREEQRVVLFMDVVGSTELAHRIGDRRFHEFLNRLATDIADPVLETAGEIYRYVGDEIIVTWPLAAGVKDAACLDCVVRIKDVLRVRGAVYEQDFGTAPRFRFALHAGALIVGEMGDVKREIVMLGDTMNTTARIEDACRTTGAGILISKVLADLLPAFGGVRLRSLGPIALRGRSDLAVVAADLG